MNPRKPRVAVMIPTASQWGRGVIEGIHNYVRKHGPWQIFVEACGESETIRIPKTWTGDGIIARVQSESMARTLHDMNIPVVNVSRIRLKSPPFPSVSTDLSSIAQVATNHFLDRGFKHFAYVSLEGVSYVKDHQRAFTACIKDLGFECFHYVSKTNRGNMADWNVNMKELGEWLQSLPKPVGIFTWNASSGRQLLNGIEWAGLNVPEEVAVLSGGDDALLCELPSTPLSGIAGASKRIGHEAAALLNRLLRGHRPPTKPTLIPPLGVVTRRSTDTLAIPEKPLADAVRFIREHADEPIKVQDVVDHVPLSRRSLERMFVRVLRRTPSEEIRKVHFERAKHLLTHTDLQEPDIAAAAGYGSSEYMIHVFKTQLGMSPIRYRKHIRSR